MALRVSAVGEFFAAIGVAGKADFVAAVHLILSGPGPTAKLSAPIVIKCGVQFFLAVHHKGPMLRYWLGNRAAFEEEQVGIGGTIFHADDAVLCKRHALTCAQTLAVQLQ